MKLATFIVSVLSCAGCFPVGPPVGPVSAPPEQSGEVITNSIGMKLVLVPAGEYEMGSPVTESERDPEELKHRVRISRPFYMGVYEVTQAEYEQIMGTNPSSFSLTGEHSDDVGDVATSRFPVETISWNDANEFCRRLSELPVEKAAGRKYRLPTEAEWEYACRAGTTSPFHFGPVLNGKQANVVGDYPYGTTKEGPVLERTTDVGQYSPNAFGLYDMHGNVSEWCSDWYGRHTYITAPRSDPQGPQSGETRVYRGGAWSDFPFHCRSAARHAVTPEYASDYKGIRVVVAK